MPVLRRITVRDFRNIALQELEFSGNINCISGNNGEGKTNLMDAIYYLSMTKSAFSTSDKFNFRYGTHSFAVSGVYDMPSGVTSRFSIQVDDSGEKKIRRDDKTVTKAADHIGVLPVVMVSPSDISLVSESGDERRKFVNSVISQLDREYLAALQQYNRLLAQRNTYLKERLSDELLLDTIDERLAKLAEPVYAGRVKLVEDLNPVVSEYYSQLSSGREQVRIIYKSDLHKSGLADILRASREKDRILKYTSSGIQRDDFIFEMNGFPIRRCGSQGQQKSFLVSLKFAQYDLMRTAYGYPPLLLLDDLFDKLDMDRTSNMLKMVAGNDFGQIFLSDSNKVRLQSIVDGITADRTYYVTSGGVFSRI